MYRKSVIRDSKIEIVDTTLGEYNLSDSEVLLEVKYSSICGSDIQSLMGNSTPNVDVIGHEFSGRPIRVGKNVSNEVIGKLFNVQPNIHCGKCKLCKKGAYSLCKEKKSYGVTLDGGFSSLAIVRIDNLVEVDETYREKSCLLEPVSCCIRAIERADPKPGSEVLILGAGFTGAVMSKILSNISCNVTFIEIDSHKIELVEKMGHRAMTSLSETGSSSYDLIVDTTSNSKLIEQSISKIRESGKFLFFGVCNPEEKIEISPFDFWKKEITFLSSRSNGHCHKKSIDFLNKNNIDDLITHLFPIQDLLDLDRIFGEKYIKGIVCM